MLLSIGSNEKNIIHTSKRLPIKRLGTFYFLDINEIYFIEKQRKKTIIYTTKGKYETNETISKLEEKLKEFQNFYRSHKSY